MIIKLGESLQWKRFKRKSRFINAIRMNESFLYETQNGWVQGHKGQWLVELAESLRCNLDNEAFNRIYSAVETVDKAAS